MYTKKTFDNLDIGDETWVYYFERKRMSSNRVWASKNAKRHSTANRLRTVIMVRKVLLTGFSRGKNGLLNW